jgi:hypothetical protein
MKQATYWYAQLVDGSKMRGGQQQVYPNDANVGVVPVEALKVFSIVHNTFSDQYYQPWDKWYINRVDTIVSYPLQYQMQDGSILTINKDKATNLLILIQEYGNGAV